MRRVRRIKEGGSFTHGVTYVNHDGAKATPTSARYRVDCCDRAIRDWTNLTPAETVIVTLDADDNTLLDQCNDYEDRELVIEFDTGLSTQNRVTHRWVVENIRGIA